MLNSKNNKREHIVGIFLILVVCIVCAFGGALKVSTVFENACTSGKIIIIQDKPYKCVEFIHGDNNNE